MPSALSILGAMTLLAAGGAGTLAYDRHPPLSWHAHVLFWRPGFDLPGGPVIVARAERDAAITASQMAQDGNKRCHASLDVQSASVAQAAQRGATALMIAQAELDATKVQNDRLRSAASSLKTFAAIPGEQMCRHWERADGAVLAVLMGVR